MDVRTPIRAALLSVVPLLIAAPDAQAVTQFASAGVATISPCPSFCGGSGIVTEREFDGPNVSSAFVDFTGVNGSGQARVDLAGQLLLPILGAQASANPNARVGSSATGLLTYDYTGLGTSIDLDFTLDGEATSPAASDASVEALVVVMRGNDFPFSTDFGTLVFELIDLTPGLDLVETERLFISSNSGPQSLSGSINIPLETGDRIAVWAQIQADGTRSGSADALDTLSFEFTSDSGPSGLAGLTPFFVPSPSSFVLLAMLLPMVACRRGTRD